MALFNLNQPIVACTQGVSSLRDSAFYDFNVPDANVIELEEESRFPTQKTYS